MPVFPDFQPAAHQRVITMSYAEKVLRSTLHRLLLAQAGLVMAAAGVYLATRGAGPAVAALFGGGIALLNSFISANRLERASRLGGDVNRSMLELYIGAIARFVATPVLVAVGIVVLHLDPVAIIVGFAVAQIGYFFNRVRTTPNS